MAPSRFGGITNLGGDVMSSGTVVVFEVQVSIDIDSFPSIDDLLFFSSGYSDKSIVDKYQILIKD